MPARIKAVTNLQILDRSVWGLCFVAFTCLRVGKAIFRRQHIHRGRPITLWPTGDKDQPWSCRSRQEADIGECAYYAHAIQPQNISTSATTLRITSSLASSLLGLRKLVAKFVPHLLTEELNRSRETFMKHNWTECLRCSGSCELHSWSHAFFEEFVIENLSVDSIFSNMNRA